MFVVYRKSDNPTMIGDTGTADTILASIPNDTGACASVAESIKIGSGDEDVRISILRHPSLNLDLRVGMASGPTAESIVEPIENGSNSTTAAVGQSADPLIDGLLSGVKWAGSSITYSDPDSVSDYQAGHPELLSNFQRISAGQLAAAHAMLDSSVYIQPKGAIAFSVEGFTNLNISYAGAGSGTGTIRLANTSDPWTAYAYYPSDGVWGGDIFFGPSGRFPTAGNYDYYTVIHELGHSLGLKHGHETDVYGALPFDTDSMEYSVMTYRSFVGSDAQFVYNEQWGYAQTFMTYDIAALQHMYGADFNTNAGDTVYKWSPTSGTTYVNGQVAIAPGGNRIFQTVWDGGGIDTYDLSNYSTNLDIDLDPGGHSTFSTAQLAYLGGGPNNGYARGNVFNALQYQGNPASLIENATGGSGRDSINGNAASNKLLGKAGNDTLRGGDGYDVLDGGTGSDVIYGGNGKDMLNGGTGADSMDGGHHDDTYIVNHAGDVAGETVGGALGGVDTVRSSVSYVLSANLENLTLTVSASSGTGNARSNVLTGNGSANTLVALEGNDTLLGAGGNDTLRGQAGADTLQGSSGADIIIGGLGRDVFDYAGGHSTPGSCDIVRAGDGAAAFQGAGDTAGDRFDLIDIDANTAAGGNQTFVFGTATGIGRLWAVNVGTNTCIRGNVDNDVTTEFELLIEDGAVLASAYSAADFFL